jgi:Cdc6-like AAA superfamily ATPase
MTKEEKSELINKIFSPSAPIENPELFIGRTEQIEKIKNAIEERGQHAIMYGGRGVGKTSVANILYFEFQTIIISKITCTRTDNFRSIWEKVINKIHFTSVNKKIGFVSEDEKFISELELPEKEYIQANDIHEILKDIPNYILIIIDEFDSIENHETKKMMADTIKYLSDNNPTVTILIIGVSDDVSDLIGDHKSLERCLNQIYVPLMTEKEIKDLASNSFEILELAVEDTVLQKLADYSSGFPHYAHLLCKYASKEAVVHNDTLITDNHLDLAVNQSIKDSDHSIKEAYNKAVSSYSDKNQFEDVIFASILAEREDKSFSPDEVLEKYKELTNLETKKESLYYNLGMLCKPERGIILQKLGTSKNRKYKFKNPLMKAFVKLQLHNKEKNISDN